MDFLDQLGKKISNAGKDVAQQANIFAETSRLNNFIAEKERQINQIYTAIGKKYYEQNWSNEDDPEEANMAQITAIRNEIAELQAHILDLKGISRCPNCGTDIPRTSAFCTRCGYRMAPTDPQPVPQFTPRTCPVCGKEATGDDKFCVNCGTQL